MIKVENSVIISKSVKEVFDFVTAAGNYLKWQPDVIEVIEEGPRNTVGSSYVEVRKFMGQELHTTLEVTAFEPNARWAAKVIKGPVAYEVTVTYEPVNGGTRFTTHVEGETKGFFKLAENMVASQLEKGIAEDNRRLKELVERD